MRALLLHVGEDLFGVPVSQAREVVVAPRIAVLPTAPPTVLGAFNLRGEIVPVFDTARLLGVGSLDSVPYVAMVDTALGLAGLVTTEIGASVDLGEPIGASETPGTVGAHAYGRRVVVMIDVDALLAPARSAG